MEVQEKVRKEVVVMPWGWGWRWWFWATGMPGWMRWAYFPAFAPSWWAYRPEDELEILEEIKKELEAELEDIKRRIEELKKEIAK